MTQVSHFIYKSYFLDFQNTKGGQVIIENNITSKVKGIGIVKLLLENRRILLLKGTRFVPEVERNGKKSCVVKYVR